MAIEEHTLESGLRVVVDEMPEAQYGRVAFRVGAGSVDEPEELAGISHHLEHSVFNGTARFSDQRQVLDYAQLNYGGVGADTSFERTLFAGGGARPYEIAKTLGSLCFEATLDEKDFEKEKEIIRKEAKRRASDEGERQAYAVRNANYESPYSRPIIGYLDGLNFSNDDLKKYYSTEYSPCNMTVFAAGNISLEGLIKVLQDEFPKSAILPSPDESLPLSFRREDPVVKESKNIWFRDSDHDDTIVLNRGAFLPENLARTIRSPLLRPGYLIAQSILQEKISNEIREKRQLSYDGSFNFNDASNLNQYSAGVSVTIDESALGEVAKIIDDTIASASENVTFKMVNKTRATLLGGMYDDISSTGPRFSSLDFSLDNNTPPVSYTNKIRLLEDVERNDVIKALDDFSESILESSSLRNYVVSSRQPGEDYTEVEPNFYTPVQ